SAGNTGRGAAYVFISGEDGWREQPPRLEASDDSLAFGTSVAISGESVVVGAPTGIAQRIDAVPGRAYVFEHSEGGWSQPQKLEAPNPTAGDLFGWSVAIEGETIVVGAPGDDTIPAPPFPPTSAYAFVRTAGGWSQPLTLATGAETAFQIGYSVAISEDTI